MRLGDLSLHVVSDGEFRLDGGAMFGVVPKPLWERQKEPDELNRIPMTANCLLVESGSELVLIDTGAGDKLTPKMRSIYGMSDQDRRLPESIATAGFELEDVTHVLLTHLHFDHCGWSTRVWDTGIVPTFPKARYWINRAELEHARNPNLRDRSTYLSDNWEPLFEAGVVELFDEEAEPSTGVRAVRAAGHSPGMCIVLLDGGRDDKGVFLADLVPTTAHVPWAWIMAYDLEPMKSLEEKQRWLPRIADEHWLCVFEHDLDQPLGRIEEQHGRLVAAPW
jgi:glyoxylase-like metal-dependent hydrolase (beta-lactamase superfamily II)